MDFKIWKSRIISHGEECPSRLLPNPKNWRKHGKLQSDALSGVLQELGWIQDVIVNLRSSDQWPPEEKKPTLLDGHLRVGLALQYKQASVPVKYVDLTPAEEAEAIATFDPIGTMAIADTIRLDSIRYF